jgi:hypothetical protein
MGWGWESSLLWSYTTPYHDLLKGGTLGVRWWEGVVVLTLGTHIPSHPPISSLPSSYNLPQLLCPSQGPICGPGSAQWGAHLVVEGDAMIALSSQLSRVSNSAQFQSDFDFGTEVLTGLLKL